MPASSPPKQSQAIQLAQLAALEPDPDKAYLLWQAARAIGAKDEDVEPGGGDISIDGDSQWQDDVEEDGSEFIGGGDVSDVSAKSESGGKQADLPENDVVVLGAASRF